MSRSVRDQLEDGVINVNHGDLNKDVKLPSWLSGCVEHLDSPGLLVDYLKEQQVLLGVLHQGLAQCIINVRAVSRRFDADKVPFISPSKAQEYMPKPLPAFKSAIDKLVDSMSEEELKALLKRKGLI